MEPTRILFVCHGNICRSPMAEMIFRHMIDEQGLRGRITVASRATSNEEIWRGRGNPLYPPAQKELIRRGIRPLPHEAKQLKAEDYDAYDYIIGMDRANMQNMLRLFNGDPEGKLYKLLSFADIERDVADPWYSDRFDVAFDDIYVGCAALLDHLTEGGGQNPKPIRR